MGADGYLETQTDGWNVPHAMTFDIILCTASSDQGFDLAPYLSLLRVHGKFVAVGLPEGVGWLVRPQSLLSNGCFIGSSHLGSRKETLDMLRLAANAGIKSWVETIPVSEEGCGKARKYRRTLCHSDANHWRTAVERLHNNDVRYRFTLVDYEKQFK
jgi:alcohol dehydrogenase (NADP+)